MKYFVAMAVLAAPLAMAAAPTPAEAGHRDGVRCHMVKKTVWKWGKRSARSGFRSASSATATATNRFTASARSRRIPDCGSGGRIFLCSFGSSPLQQEGAFLQRRKAALHEMRVAREDIAALELGRNDSRRRTVVHLVCVARRTAAPTFAPARSRG